TVKECLDTLGWEYEQIGEHSFRNIKCCGKEVKMAGWFGTEHAWCPLCGKGMQDMTGILPASSVTAGMIDVDKYDISDGRVWVAENIWRLK
ncbi:hypothetical protein, partial [Caloranaerobacter sp. DY30410]|uniref:hypothetical protein n=1 Tax=Caloranaerobacter sp. DY30410 TaxID=3238305 RepID=UPI003D019CDB